MNRIIIQVPKNIRFLSDWNDFNFKNFPLKCIINKQLPGCGFTEWCIRNKENIILASPRRHLLRNKADQHEGEVFLVVNEMESDLQVDEDLTKDRDPDGKKYVLETKKEVEDREKDLKEKNIKAFEKIKKELTDYCFMCSQEGKVMKILVTYDSYRIVKDVLTELRVFGKFKTIIDEFQSILHDSRFKSDTELQFMQALQGSETAYFVSATPMMEEYLDMLDEFKDLPYYELDWKTLDSGRVTIPQLDVKVMRTVTEEGCKIIKEFLDGNYESKFVVRDGKPVEVVSNKIILFVNSLSSILTIIKRLNLEPERINIICADTDENKKRIKKKLGKKYNIGKVPLKTDPEPDITFCTRTVYLGADFYSKCARSYVFSDANIDSLAVDISEDLPQILGRQRLDENPWKNHAYFFYKATVDYRKFTGEDFENKIKEKMKVTNDLLGIYDDSNSSFSAKQHLADVYKDNARAFHYKKNYVAVNRVVDNISLQVSLQPLLNKLVLVNEMRAFKIQQIDYKDRFTVFAAINDHITTGNVLSKDMECILGDYEKLTTIVDKLRYICNNIPEGEVYDLFLNQLSESDVIKSYLTIIGRDKIKAMSYNISNMNNLLKKVTFSPLVLENAIYQEFKEGDKIPLSEIKIKLGNIYSDIGYVKNPVGSDILEFFKIQESSVYEIIDGRRKKIRCYKLIKKLK